LKLEGGVQTGRARLVTVFPATRHGAKRLGIEVEPADAAEVPPAAKAASRFACRRTPRPSRPFPRPQHILALDGICPTLPFRILRMKMKFFPLFKDEGELIASWGQAQLIKYLDGRVELKDGSKDDRQAAQEWISLFWHEAVLRDDQARRL
jgi:hypothetical protein